MLEKNSLELHFIDPAVLCFVPSVKITINQSINIMRTLQRGVTQLAVREQEVVELKVPSFLK
jgi:hypothetical protein